jgi:hypothetical protein
MGWDCPIPHGVVSSDQFLNSLYPPSGNFYFSKKSRTWVFSIGRCTKVFSQNFEWAGLELWKPAHRTPDHGPDRPWFLLKKKRPSSAHPWVAYILKHFFQRQVSFPRWLKVFIIIKYPFISQTKSQFVRERAEQGNDILLSKNKVF